MTDATRTLEELEGVAWGEPEWQSGLVTRCHELRKKPLEDLTVGDLATLIGQNIGEQFLVPLALRVLETNAFAEGDYYPGDLLQNMLTTLDVYWKIHQEQLLRFHAVVDLASEQLAGEEDASETDLSLQIHIRSFRERCDFLRNFLD